MVRYVCAGARFKANIVILYHGVGVCVCSELSELHGMLCAHVRLFTIRVERYMHAFAMASYKKLP